MSGFEIEWAEKLWRITKFRLPKFTDDFAQKEIAGKSYNNVRSAHCFVRNFDVAEVIYTV